MTFATRAACFLAPRVLKALAATWKYREIDETGPRPPRTRLDPVLYALWHSELLPLMMRFGTLGMTTMISRHSDGDIAAAVVRSLGSRAVRGSSSAGGGGAAREMIEIGRQGSPLAITTDGPRGPARQSKPGVVRLAVKTGLPIVPIGAWPESCWRADSWDRFVIPKPGTTIYIVVRDPIHLPTALESDDVPGWLFTIDEAIEGASARARALAGGAEP